MKSKLKLKHKACFLRPISYLVNKTLIFFPMVLVIEHCRYVPCITHSSESFNVILMKKPYFTCCFAKAIF